MKKELDRFKKLWIEAEKDGVNKIFTPKWPQEYDKNGWKNEKIPFEGINKWNEGTVSKKVELNSLKLKLVQFREMMSKSWYENSEDKSTKNWIEEFDKLFKI